MLTRQEIAEVFREAMDKAEIRAKDAPEVFGVTRQALGKWLNCTNRIPVQALARLLEILGGKHDGIRAAIECYRKEANQQNHEQRKRETVEAVYSALAYLMRLPAGTKGRYLPILQQQTGNALEQAATLARITGTDKGWSFDYIRNLAIEILAEKRPIFALDRTGGKPAQFLCICPQGHEREAIRDIVRRMLTATKYLRRDEDIQQNTVLFLS